MRVAGTRGVLIGTGLVLVIVGFFVSTLVCGVGFLFITLGLVIWRRETDDTWKDPTEATPGLPGTILGRPARRRRGRRTLLALAVAGVVLAAAVGAYLLYWQLTQDRFTGIRISA